MQLTREVRFTLHSGKPSAVLNGLAGSLTDQAGMYVALQVTLSGKVNAVSSYVESIKAIDERVRQEVQPALSRMLAAGDFTISRAAGRSAEVLLSGWNGPQLVSIRFYANPFFFHDVIVTELPMVRLTQRFEFSAAHRLHNPALSDSENVRTFGKCNNSEGHGHNYEFEVTLKGQVDSNGRVIDLQQFQKIVNENVVERFDHKYLNTQTEEFAKTIPSVENIADVIYRLLDGKFPHSVLLQSVRVWETGKTWAERFRE